MTTPRITGINLDDLGDALRSGVDHGGNAIEPFVDHKGGWPLRCCLSNSEAGDEIAIIAWSPFPWTGAYAETGPVVVHISPCTGPSSDRLELDFDQRAMVLRPYGPDQRIAYHRVQHVDPGSSLTDELAALLEQDDVVFVHGRNITGGCYAFTAERAS